jgi:hypothetical protein
MAMDGNFAPFIDALPLNASTKMRALSEIALLENQTLTVGLFGDHDGVVNAVDLARFESLIQQSSRFLRRTPATSGVGLFLSLDGQPPSSTTFDGTTFLNALGPVSSSSPITINSQLTYQLTLSGGSHILLIRLPSNLLLSNASGVLPVVQISFQAPAGMSITGVAGLNRETSTNDFFGWNAPRANGSFTPGSTSNVTFRFGPAFPWGDILVVVPPVAAGAGGVGGYWLFRRRKGRSDPEEATEGSRSGSE